MNPEQIQQLADAFDRTAINAGQQGGWTAEIMVLLIAVLVACVAFVGSWFLRLHQQSIVNQRKDLTELKEWRHNIVTEQLTTTTRALDESTAAKSHFSGQLADNTQAVEENTSAVRSLCSAIQHAPCGKSVDSDA